MGRDQGMDKALPDAQRLALEVARAYGLDSQAHLTADAEVGAILKRRKEILGTSGQHWMA
jgi:hypothetical protein